MFDPNCDEYYVDFEFFEGDYVNKYEKRNQIDSSKIVVTKAVIETTPFHDIDSQEHLKYPTESSKLTSRTRPKKNQDLENTNTRANKIIDYLSSPSSSLEKVSLIDSNLDSNLLNCLAYNDKLVDSDVDLSDSNFYSSDSSLSESSITPVSSDFTTVSPVLSISDSSLSEESVEDSFPDNDMKDEQLVSDESVQDSFQDNESKDEQVENIEDDDVVVVSCKEIEQSVESDSEEISQSYSSIVSDNDFKVNSENSNGNDIGCSDYESEKNTNGDISEVEANISSLERDLEDVSLASQTRSTPNSSKLQSKFRGSSKFLGRKKEWNLTFSREELIKIERENLILLKKIMSHAKPKSVSLNQSFHHTKTSAAINRARQQKKIEQDNYILYSKICALGRMKKVF